MIVQLAELVPALIRLYRSTDSEDRTEFLEHGTELVVYIWKLTAADDGSSKLFRRQWDAEFRNAQKCLRDARIAKNPSVRERLTHDARLIFGEIAEKHENPVIQLRAMISISICYALLKEDELARKWQQDAYTFSANLLERLVKGYSKVPPPDGLPFFEDDDNGFWRDLVYISGGWLYVGAKTFVDMRRDNKREKFREKIIEVRAIYEELEKSPR